MRTAVLWQSARVPGGLVQWIASVCLLVMPQLVSAEQSSARIPQYERVQLRNGAVLLLMERHDVPLVSISAVLRGGTGSEPPAQFGVANLLAALLEKGAGSRDAFAFADAVAEVGGTINAAAELRNIRISGSFLARDQTLMVMLLADMLQRPRLDAAQFEMLRGRMIDAIRAAKDSDLASLSSIYGRALLFGDHPFGRPASGTEQWLANATLADVQAHYRTSVGADRLILAVVGDFRTAQMKQMLSRALSGWRKAPAPMPPVTAAPQLVGRRVLLVDAPDSVQSYFWAGNVGVSRQDKRRVVLDVVNTLLGGRFTSMLNTELRVRTGLSYGAESHFERYEQPGVWEMSSFTRTETTIEAMDLAMSVLDKLHAEAIAPDALASARTYVQGQFPLALETPSQLATILCTLELYGLERRYIDDYLADVGAVTVDATRQAIREVFPTSSDLALVVIGNASVLREGLRKYGPITEMKLSDPTFRARLGVQSQAR
jgi:zinc protease